LDWRAKVELYEQIRREYEFGVGSVIGVARKLGVHRRMVREAVRSAVPAQRKKTERPAVKMAAAASLIESILESDRRAPRKQRHTSRRIYERILAEVPGCTPAERTVRQYVERRKRALGLVEHEIFVPQSYAWGTRARKPLPNLPRFACADLRCATPFPFRFSPLQGWGYPSACSCYPPPSPGGVRHVATCHAWHEKQRQRSRHP
jgi:hypothetical protein